jgi:hypothetical protein
MGAGVGGASGTDCGTLQPFFLASFALRYTFATNPPPVVAEDAADKETTAKEEAVEQVSSTCDGARSTCEAYRAPNPPLAGDPARPGNTAAEVAATLAPGMTMVFGTIVESHRTFDSMHLMRQLKEYRDGREESLESLGIKGIPIVADKGKKSRSVIARQALPSFLGTI